MKLNYVENFYGRSTEASYEHKGCQKAARFPGWLSEETVRRSLIAFRTAVEKKI